MYNELIYTRCGEGIDILRGRNPIKNSGFKVYSCSTEVTENGCADLPFLNAVAQSKEPYADPSFMDDAYLYLTPDLGGKFLLNFHPIPFDRNATGDYSHRPGNFINQIFIGQFDDGYPYETFGNKAVWDAQARGEAFYYENSPSPLKPRSSLTDSIGSISLDEIAAFVAAGRREVLMSAIAFIIAQYSQPAEERKFLVIRDENSRNIELWVAAIESAFSPRMSSGLSFATRLDKFVNANKYTVNLNGQYQTQINLQSPTQKLRFKAMIVGVDERDRTNISGARALANSPFVLLDGRAKTLSVSMDTSNPYYRYVTAYDEGHTYLCREFMQMVDLSIPSDDVFKIYAAYSNLVRYGTSSALKDLLAALTALNQYRLIRTPYLVKLYTSIKKELPTFLQTDAISAFSVLSWLEKTSAIVGDTISRDGFKEIICKSYAEKVYSCPRDRSTLDLNGVIKKSSFFREAAEHLVSQETISNYEPTVKALKPDDWKAFSELFVECLRYARNLVQPAIAVILPVGLYALYQAKEGQSALEMATLFSNHFPEQTGKLLFEEAGKTSDQYYGGFLVQLITRVSPSLTSSESNLSRYYQQLRAIGLENHFGGVLVYKAKSITRLQETERFLDLITTTRDYASIDLAPVFKAIDGNISLSDKMAERLAYKIQRSRPANAVCVKSAHLYALEILSGKRADGTVTSELRDLIAQGFPSLEENGYAQKLVNQLLDHKLPLGTFSEVVAAAANSSFYSDLIVRETLKCLGSRQENLICDLFDLAAQVNSNVLHDALVRACAELKSFDKSTMSLRLIIRQPRAQQYYSMIEKEAKALREQQKEPSIFGRMFSRGNPNNSNFGPWGKK